MHSAHVRTDEVLPASRACSTPKPIDSVRTQLRCLVSFFVQYMRTIYLVGSLGSPVIGGEGFWLFERLAEDALDLSYRHTNAKTNWCAVRSANFRLQLFPPCGHHVMRTSALF